MSAVASYQFHAPSYSGATKVEQLEIKCPFLLLQTVFQRADALWKQVIQERLKISANNLHCYAPVFEHEFHNWVWHNFSTCQRTHAKGAREFFYTHTIGNPMPDGKNIKIIGYTHP